MSASVLYSGGSSKTFVDGSLAARLDTGHTSHNKEPHIHIGEGKPLKLTSTDAVATYARIAQNQMIEKASKS